MTGFPSDISKPVEDICRKNNQARSRKLGRVQGKIRKTRKVLQSMVNESDNLGQALQRMVDQLDDLLDVCERLSDQSA